MRDLKFSSSNPLVVLELKSILGLWQRGQLGLAVDRARSICASYPKEAVANFSLAQMLAEMSKLEEALPFAEAAVKLSPENIHYLVFLGGLYRDFSVFEAALPLYQKA